MTCSHWSLMTDALMLSKMILVVTLYFFHYITFNNSQKEESHWYIHNKFSTTFNTNFWSLTVLISLILIFDHPIVGFGVNRAFVSWHCHSNVAPTTFRKLIPLWLPNVLCIFMTMSSREPFSSMIHVVHCIDLAVTKGWGLDPDAWLTDMGQCCSLAP